MLRYGSQFIKPQQIKSIQKTILPCHKTVRKIGNPKASTHETRPSSDSEAATMYKLKGKSSNLRTGQGFKTRLRLFFSESQCRDETETFFLLVSMSRLFQSLNIETRPRLLSFYKKFPLPNPFFLL